MPTTSKTLLAAEVIRSICADLKYSRGHVAKVLRENRGKLRARLVDGRWRISRASVVRFIFMVKTQSGVRYKLGHRGPHERP